MPAPKNLIHETSTSTGTGNLTVAAENGKIRFSDATYGFGTGGTNAFDYFISNRSAAEWEIGTGSMSDANTLVRDTVVFSSNANAAVNFSAGTKDITNDDIASLRLNSVLTTRGDLVYRNATVPARLAVGTVSQVLGSDGTDPVWKDAVGRQELWIPAKDMTARATSPAAAGILDSGANDNTFPVFDFDQTTQEYVNFQIALPNRQAGAGLSVTFIPYWTASAGTAAQTVVWTLAGRGFDDDVGLDNSVGTAQSSTDALLATNDMHIGPESSAITVSTGGSGRRVINFQLSRDVATDTLAADARLIGILLAWTSDALTDA